MEQHQNPPQTQQPAQPPQPKKKASKGKKLWLIIGIIVGISLLIGGIVLFANRANSTIWAKVGNFEITKSTYKTLMQELPNRVNDKSNYNAQKDTERTLILNAALKTEADKKNISYSEQDVDNYLEETYKTTSFGSGSKYRSFLRDQYKWSDETIKVFTENEFLMRKLRADLLAEKSLISTAIRWDTLKLPAAKGISESSIVDAMNGKFLPLYEAKKSIKEIAQAADVNPFNSYEINNAARETNPFTYSQFTVMDSLTQKNLEQSFQNYDGLTRDIDEIDKLNEVGDFTKPFKSASGYYAIYRLEKLSGGKYKSWEEIIDKYSPRSLGRVLGHIDMNQEEVGKTASILSSYFIGQANAQTTAGTSGTCLGGHAIGFEFSFATTITAPPNYTKVSGGSVSINGIRNNGLCNYNTMPNPFFFNGTRFDYSNISSPWSGVNLTASRTINSTNPNSGEVIYFDCNGPAPTMTITPPPGYEYVQTLIVVSRINPDTGEIETGIPIVTTLNSFNLGSVRYDAASASIDYYSNIANGRNYAAIVQVRPITPPIYDGTIQVAKYLEGAPLGVFPASVSQVNGAKVGIRHSTYNAERTSNPGIFDNEWVNHGSHNSNSKDNYEAYVDVPRGWKVVRATNRGSNATLNGSCGSGGRCYIVGVTVDNDNEGEVTPTYVDFFFEPDVIGNLDGICTSPNETSSPQQPASQNGKVWGWVKDSYNNGGFSKVDIYIDGGPGNAAWGSRVDANRPREAAVGGNYGFEVDVPKQFFDGNEHSLRIYVLRDNGGFDGGPGNNPYQLKIIKTSYNGIISVQDPNIGKFSCPPPTGRVTCLKEGDNNFIQGWTFDPQKTEGPSQVHIYYDDAPGGGNDRPQGATGSIKLSEAEITARKNEGYRGVDDNGLYRFRVSIPDRLHDGNNHEIRVYMITEGNNTPNPALEFVNLNSTVLNIGPNNPNCGKVDKWNWPWLQTQNGDVIASGEITGQKVGTNLPGARPADKFDKEAEYMVISMLGGGGPFCSTYEYILTNTQATTNDQSKCDNGGGYGTLSLYSLNESGEDKIYKAVEDAFIANGSGNSPENTKCSPYNTLFEGRFNPIDTGIEGRGQPTCLNGTIIKASGSLSNIVVNSGRNTIFSDSELFIFGDITYSTDPRGYFQPDAEKKVPNLAIVVKGDIKIAPSVKRIDAALYATGKIYTCNGNGNPGQTSPPENCREQLVVNGSLISKDGYLFGRSFTNASRSPAELIQLTGQTVAFPPPGLDNRYFEDFSNKIRIDTSEFEPKF